MPNWKTCSKSGQNRKTVFRVHQAFILGLRQTQRYPTCGPSTGFFFDVYEAFGVDKFTKISGFLKFLEFFTKILEFFTEILEFSPKNLTFLLNLCIFLQEDLEFSQNPEDFIIILFFLKINANISQIQLFTLKLLYSCPGYVSHHTLEQNMPNWRTCSKTSQNRKTVFVSIKGFNLGSRQTPKVSHMWS